MALRANGTAANVVRLESGAPNWGALTIGGFFSVKTDRNAFSTVLQVGAPVTYTNKHFVIQTGTDGTTLNYYEDSVGGSGTFVDLTVGRTYGLMIRNTGTSLEMYLLDTVTGTVTTLSKTLPAGYDGTAMIGFRLGDDHYSEQFNGNYFGWKLWSADIGDAAALNELRKIAPARLTSIAGWWPMVGDTKSRALTDYSGNGLALVESGSAFTVEDGGPIPWGAQPIIVPGVAVTQEQEGFRFYNDDGSESAATALAAQDTNSSLAPDTPKRLRMLINAAGDPPSSAYKLQFRKVGDPSWTDVA